MTLENVIRFQYFIRKSSIREVIQWVRQRCKLEFKGEWFVAQNGRFGAELEQEIGAPVEAGGELAFLGVFGVFGVFGVDEDADDGRAMWQRVFE